MVAILVALVSLATGTAPAGPRTSGQAAAATAPHDLGSVENLYATDLLARVNAERAARTSPAQPIPQLEMNAALNAAAQAWAEHIAATGVLQDAPLSGCGSNPPPSTLCVLAANAGNSGNGFWPGDGSDGMETD